MAKKSRGKKKRNRALVVGSVAEPPTEVLKTPSFEWWTRRFLPGFALFAIVAIYSYLPTLAWMVGSWRTEPDYSHGFLVVPLAVILLIQSRGNFPGFRTQVSWAGLSLVFLSILMRVASRIAYADFLDGWSLIPLVAGVTWFMFGPRAMRWALPAILFLVLMVPMPYQAESLLSWKLQGVATALSTTMLRVFGQPAVAESHVIWLNGERLLVEQACSGLRIFVGVGAFAYFWAVLANRSHSDRIVILLSAVPLALFANAVRITTIGLLYPYFTSDSARHWIHDATGLAMIPFAFGLLGLTKWYWEHLYRPLDKATAREMLTSS